jgi:hypothetical protein
MLAESPYRHVAELAGLSSCAAGGVNKGGRKSWSAGAGREDTAAPLSADGGSRAAAPPLRGREEWGAEAGGEDRQMK